MGPGEEPAQRPGGGGASQNFKWIQVGGCPNQNSGRGSHIEAQILLFFKEIVKDEFAHEVWVQRVVDHLSPSKLDWGGGVPRVSAGSARIPGAALGWERTRTDLPPLLAGPGLRVKHHHCRQERGRGGKDVRSFRSLPPRCSVAPAHQVPHSHPTLVPPTGVGLGEGVEVQQVPRESNRQTGRG